MYRGIRAPACDPRGAVCGSQTVSTPPISVRRVIRVRRSPPISTEPIRVRRVRGVVVVIEQGGAIPSPSSDPWVVAFQATTLTRFVAHDSGNRQGFEGIEVKCYGAFITKALASLEDVPDVYTAQGQAPRNISVARRHVVIARQHLSCTLQHSSAHDPSVGTDSSQQPSSSSLPLHHLGPQ